LTLPSTSMLPAVVSSRPSLSQIWCGISACPRSSLSTSLVTRYAYTLGSSLGWLCDSDSCQQYGLVYPGVGWVVWRSAEFLPQELVFNINYLGADQASFTLNFSKGASQVIGQYYQLIRLGKHGYRSIMHNLTRTADYLSDALEALGYIIMSKKGGEGLPLVAFRLTPDENRHFDEFALAHQLRVRGWVVPAYTMAPHTENLKMLRVVVREDFTRNRCDSLICDIKLSHQVLEDMDKDSIKRQNEFIHQNHTASGKASHNHPKYRKEKHSLQGKTGKTHAVCWGDG
jgi:glutamate decarboxylase